MRKAILILAALAVLPAAMPLPGTERRVEVMGELTVAARCEAATTTLVLLGDVAAVIALATEAHGDPDAVAVTVGMISEAGGDARDWMHAVRIRRDVLLSEAHALRIGQAHHDLDAARDVIMGRFMRELRQAVGSTQRLRFALITLDAEAEECGEWARE